MSIKRFIQKEILLPRLRQSEVLVVYDSEHKYHDLCLEMKSENICVIDASESSIESREQAICCLNKLGQNKDNISAMLIYIPADKPLSDEAKQQDPFSIYGLIGSVFPNSDGDEFFNLCLKHKADYSTEIRKIFAENSNPSFEVIDAIGHGNGWPNLQAILGVESAREILLAILTPNSNQESKLKNTKDWLGEANQLFQATLGFQISTKSKNYNAICEELWRYLLFSEFLFDLPVALPEELANVPCACKEAKALVNDICDNLRDSDARKSVYLERAEQVENELELSRFCHEITDLGERDTFPFEERSFFKQAVCAYENNDIDLLFKIINHIKTSIWRGYGENQIQWQLMETAALLTQACKKADLLVKDYKDDLDTIIEFYASYLREVDCLQREFEQTTREIIVKDDETISVISLARKIYKNIVDKVHYKFIESIKKCGWPSNKYLSNSDVFDKFIAPKLKENGHKIAVFFIDALRYELGIELKNKFNDEAQVNIQVACAQMPSITSIGMASLLPNAASNLKLRNKDNHAVICLDDIELPALSDRMNYLKKMYGQRFHEMELSSFLNGGKIPNTTELLVLRSVDIDSSMENNPDTGLKLIQQSLRTIYAAIHELRKKGYKDAYILTDHGFFLNASNKIGDVCKKPNGNWLNLHERIMLGDGSADNANIVLDAHHIGIKGDFNQVAFPKELITYRKGDWYFHGGISLQEDIVPVIELHLKGLSTQATVGPNIALSYKSTRITTRIPSILISAISGDLFCSDASYDVLLEAYDDKGNVVGEAKIGGPVNPATRILTIKDKESFQISLRMNEDFEGEFIVKALDPATRKVYSKLTLKTDYLE